jgi:hypothetical protein
VESLSALPSRLRLGGITALRTLQSASLDRMVSDKLEHGHTPSIPMDANRSVSSTEPFSRDRLSERARSAGV